MKLVVNLSSQGRNPTGLGAFSSICGDALSHRFQPDIIAGRDDPPAGTVIARAPEGIGIGDSRLASLRRARWLRSLQIGSERLVYSPTHHAIPGVSGQIITIHDLIPLRFPTQQVKQYLYFRHWLPRILQSCRAVFTVSETTKQDIEQRWHIPGERIFVVPNAVDKGFFSPGDAPGTAQPYLLVVGATFPHKNIAEILRHAQLWATEFRLVVVAPRTAYRQQLARLASRMHLAEKITFYDYVPKNELRDLYRACSALIYPSLWEGFGIPPLEAMACGKPVIASDIPAHREVLGNAAYLVQLGDPASWSGAFRSVRSHEANRDKIATMAEVLARYTPEKTAAKLCDALVDVEPKLRQHPRRHS